MKTKLLSAAIGLLCAAAMLWGCQQKPNEEPNPPAPTHSDFLIVTSDIVFDGFAFTLTPDDDEASYHCGYISKSVYEDYESEEEFIGVEVAKIDAAAKQNEQSFAQYVTENGLIAAGAAKDTIVASLDADTEYYVYAYSLGLDGTFGKTMDKVLIKTPVAPTVVKRDDAKFDFEINLLESHSFAFVVYPSDMQMRTFVGYMTKEKYTTTLEGTPQNVAQSLIDAFENNANLSGVTVGAVARAECLKGIQLVSDLYGATANTPYVGYAIGFDSQGRQITDVTIYEFVTPEVKYSDATLTITADKYYDGDALADLDPKYDKYRGKAYVVINNVPDGKTAASWKVAAGKAGPLDEQPDDLLAAYIDQKGSENQETQILGAIWDTEYLVLGVAKNDKGETGALVKVRVTPTKSGVSPVSDIIAASTPQNVLQCLDGELSKFINDRQSKENSIINLKNQSAYNIR